MPRTRDRAKRVHNETPEKNISDEEVEAFESHIYSIVRKLAMPSLYQDPYTSDREHTDERNKMTLALYFPNLSEAERRKIYKLGRLGSAIVRARWSRTFAANARPADPGRVRLAGAVVKAELRYIKAERTLEHCAVRAKLSELQELLLDRYIAIPHREFGPAVGRLNPC